MSFIVTQLSTCSRILSSTVRFVLNHAGLSQCYACNHSTNDHDQSGLATWLCKTCNELLLQNPRVSCIQCGLRLGEKLQTFGWPRCRNCKKNNDPLMQTTVLQDYAPPWSNWISMLKYGNQPEIATMLGDLLAQQITNKSLARPDVLVPSPISHNKLKARGFNQAELIAQRLSIQLKIPLLCNVLIKTNDTPNQALLSKQQRQKNLNLALLCKSPLNPEHTIGIVDDVITTGSTMQASMQACKKAGAKQFHNLAICRTPEPFIHNDTAHYDPLP